MTDNRCADCIHLAPWPERVEFIREYVKAVPEGFSLCACMQCPTKVMAVAPDDGGDCRHFERGNRKKHYKEV